MLSSTALEAFTLTLFSRPAHRWQRSGLRDHVWWWGNIGCAINAMVRSQVWRLRGSKFYQKSLNLCTLKLCLPLPPGQIDDDRTTIVTESSEPVRATVDGNVRGRHSLDTTLITTLDHNEYLEQYSHSTPMQPGTLLLIRSPPTWCNYIKCTKQEF